MEFGKVTDEELETIDFSLPPDRGETTTLLSRHSNGVQTKVYVGCAKWGRKDWVGKIYPKGTKEADFLSHYGRHFNGIELNATFYKMPSAVQTAAWKSKVGKDFQFCPKFTGAITHIKRLKDVEELTDRFLKGIAGFGETLGPVLFMPHPAMGPKSLETIQAFIESLPKDLRIAVELRHEGWFQDKDVFKKTFDMFERNNAGVVLTDVLGRRDCVHMRLTTPEVFIRFVGNGLHPSDYRRVDDWADRIHKWIGEGIQRVYFFMHQHDEIHSPELCKYVIQQLNKVCNLQIPEPTFVE